jgi:Icc-related predicted phosphoesterase
LFATDLHGSEQTFLKFLNAAKMYSVDVCILGGDMTGKILVPLVREKDGRVRCSFQGQEMVVRSEQELEQLVKTIRLNGGYPYMTDPEGVDELNASPEARERVFCALMRDQVERWVRLAQERLAPAGIRCYMTGGNDDPWLVEQILDSAGGNVLNAEGKVVDIGAGYEMCSTGCGNLTPWKCPRDVGEDELWVRISGMASRVQNMARCVFNFHVPPYDSGLDTCPKLDTSVFPPRPVVGETTAAGSRAVRRAIEEYQPALALHGHIHESRGAYRLGRTLCLNPGSEYGEGILRAVLVLLDEKGVKSYQFISG